MKMLILDEDLPVAVANVKRAEISNLRNSLRGGYFCRRLPAGKKAADYGVPEWSATHTSIAMIFG